MVYVDDMEAPFGGMTMCHMAAESTEELLAMADRIGVQRKWIQKPGTDGEHFDIAKGKRARAISCGAVPVTMRDLCSVGWSRGPMDFAAGTPLPERRARRSVIHG